MAPRWRRRRLDELLDAGVDELLEVVHQDDTPWPILDHEAWIASIESALHLECPIDSLCQYCRSAPYLYTEDRYSRPPADRE